MRGLIFEEERCEGQEELKDFGEGYVGDICEAQMDRLVTDTVLESFDAVRDAFCLRRRSSIIHGGD